MSKLTNTAVKAVIFRDDGRLLMQQRDEAPGLPFPECWTFFGGLAETGETPADALERELVEELGRVPGPVGPELLQWEWQSDWACTRNHFFPVRCEVQTGDLVLAEGKAMAWLSLEDMVRLPLTPAVYENFSEIVRFAARYRDDPIDPLEQALLEFYDLRKKHERVFYAKRNPCLVSRQQMFFLKALASLREIPVFRVCMHVDDQCDIHEMLMVHTRPTSVGPLKQNKTSLSYHVQAGALTIKLYDESGNFANELLVGEGNPSPPRGTSIRLDASQYRSVHSTSPFAIFLEVASGPFKDSDTLWLEPGGRAAVHAQPNRTDGASQP